MTTRELIIKEMEKLSDDEGFFSVSKRHVSKVANCSETNAKYHLKKLVTDGIIKIVENRSRFGMPTIYKII